MLTSSDSSHVWYMEFETAEEFIEEISPLGPFFVNEEPGNWLFRGHSRKAFQLVPKAFRDNATLYQSDGTSCSPQSGWTCAQQIEAELGTARLFHRTADSSGLPLPEDSQILRQRLEQAEEQLKFNKGLAVSEWPPVELLSLLAMAQHSGMSTRLLDWTRNPYIALYFAAVEAASREDDGDQLHVWALSERACNAETGHKRRRRMLGAKFDQTALKIVTAPAAANQNLHAQQGVFTLDMMEQKVGPDSPAERMPLDQRIDSSWTRNPIQVIEGPVLMKFTVNASVAHELLWLLARVGVTAASVWPDFRGVAAALEERNLWFPLPASLREQRRIANSEFGTACDPDSTT